MGVSSDDRGPGGSGRICPEAVGDVVYEEGGDCMDILDAVDGESGMPDPVRVAAVRAVILVAVTLVLVMVAVLCSLARVWLALPMVLAAVAGTVVTTWGVLDVWVTRQMWIQRNGVVSTPGSVARERAVFRRRHG